MFKYIKYNFASTPLGNKPKESVVDTAIMWNLFGNCMWKRYFLKKNIREAGDVVRIHICSQLMSIFLYAFARLFYPKQLTLHWRQTVQYKYPESTTQCNFLYMKEFPVSIIVMFLFWTAFWIVHFIVLCFMQCWGKLLLMHYNIYPPKSIALGYFLWIAVSYITLALLFKSGLGLLVGFLC